VRSTGSELNVTGTEQCQVVIVGAGFAGIACA
jgi:cation diffusion facilitator CzcD-associated flavoprotein CzcO